LSRQVDCRLIIFALAEDKQSLIYPTISSLLSSRLVSPLCSSILSSLTLSVSITVSHPSVIAKMVPMSTAQGMTNSLIGKRAEHRNLKGEVKHMHIPSSTNYTLRDDTNAWVPLKQKSESDISSGTIRSLPYSLADIMRGTHRSTTTTCSTTADTKSISPSSSATAELNNSDSSPTTVNHVITPWEDQVKAIRKLPRHSQKDMLQAVMVAEMMASASSLSLDDDRDDEDKDGLASSRVSHVFTPWEDQVKAIQKLPRNQDHRASLKDKVKLFDSQNKSWPSLSYK
jgi:hypothetical protein